MRTKRRIVKIGVLTIPKLELVAAILATRLVKFVANAVPFPFATKIIWLDAKIVLNWIVTSKTLPTFQRNQIQEIRSLQGVVFHHIAGIENPADLPNRGSSSADMDQSNWWCGCLIHQNGRRPSQPTWKQTPSSQEKLQQPSTSSRQHTRHHLE